MQFFEPQNARAVKKNKEKCLELLVLIFTVLQLSSCSSW